MTVKLQFHTRGQGQKPFCVALFSPHLIKVTSAQEPPGFAAERPGRDHCDRKALWILFLGNLCTRIFLIVTTHEMFQTSQVKLLAELPENDTGLSTIFYRPQTHFLESKKFLKPELRHYFVHPRCPNQIWEVHFGVTSFPLYLAVMQYAVHLFSSFSKSHFLAQVHIMLMLIKLNLLPVGPGSGVSVCYPSQSWRSTPHSMF